MEQRVQYIVRLFAAVRHPVLLFAACITGELHLPPVCPLSPFPASSSPLLLSRSLERTTAPSFPLSLEGGIWKTGSVSATLYHIQSSACLFSSPPFPPSLSPSLCPARLPLLCSPCLSSSPQRRLSQSCIFPFLSISPQLFSSPPSCRRLTLFPLTFPLCLGGFLSWKMQYHFYCTRMEDAQANLLYSTSIIHDKPEGI